MKLLKRLAFALALTALAASALAGNLDAPGTPATGSGMPTTAGIYNRLDSGAAISVPGAFQEPVAGPTAGSGRTLAEIGSRLPAPDNVNGAKAGEVAAGKTFWGLRTDGAWGLSSGAIAAGTNVTGANGLLSFPIPNALYSSGKTATASDSNLISGNIKSGVSIFGVSGTASQASGTAAATDVLSGKTFSNGSATGINGSMPDIGAVAITPGASAQPIAAGYHNGSGSVAGDSNLVAGNIRSGASIFGVSGTATVLDMTHVVNLSVTCASHWRGASCNVCDGVWTGANCDVCPVNWSGTNCDIIAKPFPSTLPSYSSTPWKCVLDSASGLTWEIKTSDGGLHDKSNTYTWYDSADWFDPFGNPGTATAGSCIGQPGCDTEKYVAAVNAEGLCGYSNWRMPSLSELSGLISGTPSPTTTLIDLAYFPNTLRNYYWSGTMYAPNLFNAWIGDFAYNSSVNEAKSNAHAVRLVRGP